MQGKADDTSGLTPTKDDNEALQKSDQGKRKFLIWWSTTAER